LNRIFSAGPDTRGVNLITVKNLYAKGLIEKDFLRLQLLVTPLITLTMLYFLIRSPVTDYSPVQYLMYGTKIGTVIINSIPTAAIASVVFIGFFWRKLLNRWKPSAMAELLLRYAPESENKPIVSKPPSPLSA
jgi:hypothetical protein